ncbi:MAG: DNA repair protein RadA [Paludibacteraceae bacterium]|nr:DNA repair protein RadA [Paludibacteraceae bacterium]
MKITVENALTEFPKIADKFSDEINQVFNMPGFPSWIKVYGRSEKIDKLVDDWLAQVNEFLSESKEEDAPKKKKEIYEVPKIEVREPKFKVGDKVLTDHSSTNVYTISEVGNGKYKLAETTGWWSESQLEKAPNKKKEVYEAPEITVKDEPKKRETKKKKEKGKKEKETKKKKEDESNYVESIPESRKIIKRFVDLVEKKSSKKDFMNEARLILSSLQKSIVEKKIRKTDDNANYIRRIQNLLCMCLNENNNNIEVKDKDLEKMREIGNSEKVSESVKLAKAYISIQGKADIEKAKNLLNRINKAIKNDKVAPEVMVIKKSVQDFVDEKTEKIEATKRELRGIYGLSGIEEVENENDDMNSLSLLNKNFTVLNLGGKWGDFIGKPSTNLKMMVYGMPGNGKSTFSIQFAAYLSKQKGMKVLYVASEEKLGYTLKEKLMRLDAANSNLWISEDIEGKDLSQYDVVFLDSINDLNMTSDDLNKLPKNVAYVWVVQCTKDGSYRGDQGLAHDCDIVIKVESMKATTQKNRFGGGVVFDVL